METELLHNVDPADILAYAREVPTPAGFLLTQEVVPETFINNVKYRIKSRERRVNTAKFRAYDASTPMGRREVQHAVTEGMLPPLGQVFTVGELETILLSISRGADNQELVDALYNDVERHVLGIKHRLELAAGDVLEDGIFSLVDENGLTIEADFGVDAAFLPDATTLWSNPNAGHINQERLWIEHLIDEGDGAPAEAITSTAVLRQLARSEEYKQLLYGDLVDVTGRPTLLPGQINEARARAGLPPVRAYDVKVRVDGVQKRTIAENRFILLPENKEEFAETQYGITAEALTLARNGNPRIEREDLPGIVVTAWEQDNPISTGTKSAAVAMPVLYGTDSFVSAKVL
ncbi:major capsid protein [Aeromicrobium sp. Leaf291]|uniref:major capsid protein n=1 Tax=Aeromicrobium sp. Leaf291 TaxID=1736325 RepID=UPI00070197D0|nr:major capsid protein [Aeromicrobium sp. Leaf291]KQP81580.1 hypothetical protein ASF35_16245 [Aeromicrobium sp. Leaf291]